MSDQRWDLPERAYVTWLVVVVVLGAALRAGGLATDFWLDEVWTWSIARGLTSPLGVFTEVHHSNNHHLLTLWYYALGPDASVLALRLPSWIAGVASILLVAAVARPAGRLEAALAATFAAVCFALVHFSSEARGYALAVAFALAAQLALDRQERRPGIGPALGFGAAVALGLLAHLTTVFYWAGAAALSLRRLRGLPPAGAIRRLVALHALPLIALAVLYALDLRELAVGGGNVTDLPALLARIVGFSFGLPVVRELGVASTLIAILVLSLAIYARARRRDDRWIGDEIQILVAPTVVFAVLRPDVTALRYFLIAIAFTLPLLAELLAAGLRRGTIARAVALFAIAAFVVGHARHDAAFLALGRGGYAEAVRTMAAHDPDATIEVGSDHDFRNGLVLRFHARELPPERRLLYRPRSRWRTGGPRWFIIHRAQRPEQPRLALAFATGERFRLLAEYDHAAISGFYWALYRNDRPPEH